MEGKAKAQEEGIFMLINANIFYSHTMLIELLNTS